MRGLFALGACLLALPSQADIYQYRDVYGHITLTDKPMRGRVTLEKVYSLKGHRTSPTPKGSLSQRRQHLAPIISRIAREESMQSELLHAVVHAESAYDPRAESSKGAVGLMQLMPATAQRYGVSDRRDPVQNLRAGARYLRDLLALFHNDLTLALAAYNAGENAVIRYGHRVPPYPETQRYVQKVREIFDARRGQS